MSYPYTTAFAKNKPSETVFYCVSCAKEMSDNPMNDFMDIPHHSELDYIQCKKCNEVVREPDN